MHKFLRQNWLLLGCLPVYFIALWLERNFPDTYMISLSRRGGGSPKIPVSVLILFLIIYLGIAWLLNYRKSTKYFLNKGFLEAQADILSIKENGSFGEPRSHSLYLILHVVVKATKNSAFETDIHTTVRENGNAATPPIRRTPDYKIGDMVTVLYHPESHETIIPKNISPPLR